LRAKSRCKADAVGFFTNGFFAWLGFVFFFVTEIFLCLTNGFFLAVFLAFGLETAFATFFFEVTFFFDRDFLATTFFFAEEA
jgi:hypothetical protein